MNEDERDTHGEQNCNNSKDDNYKLCHDEGGKMEQLAQADGYVGRSFSSPINIEIESFIDHEKCRQTNSLPRKGTDKLVTIFIVMPSTLKLLRTLAASEYCFTQLHDRIRGASGHIISKLETLP